MTASGSTSEQTEVHGYVPPRSARNLVVVVVVGALISGWIGAAFAPTLVLRHPLLLAGLNANNRYLILVTNQLGAPSFYTVALARRVIPTMAFFYLGHWYGPRAVAWFKNRDPGSSEAATYVERIFERAGWWVVVIAPMTLTGLLAGAARFRPSRFAPVILVSIAARIIVLRQLGEVFSGPVDSVVHWIDRSRGPLLVISLLTVGMVIWSQRKRRTASLEALTALDDDLED